MRNFFLTLLTLLILVSPFACSKSYSVPPLAAGSIAPTATPIPALLYNAPATISGGFFVTRGFYTPSYPGSSLSSVVLYIAEDTVGSYTYSLSAMLSAYNGTTIGTAYSPVITQDGSTTLLSDYQPVTFNYSGNPSVANGSTVAFILNQLTGPGTSFYDGNGAAPMTITTGTTPPLDTYHHTGMAILLYGDP